MIIGDGHRDGYGESWEKSFNNRQLIRTREDMPEVTGPPDLDGLEHEIPLKIADTVTRITAAVELPTEGEQ